MHGVPHPGFLILIVLYPEKTIFRSFSRFQYLIFLESGDSRIPDVPQKKQKRNKAK